MNWRSKSEIRRCRPLLGTFVEITASGWTEETLHEAVTAAYNAMESVQGLMSVHDPESELSRLNRESLSHPVTVSRETFAVLGRAGRLAAESRGAFDYTIAPTLAGWGLLPVWLERKKPGNWRHVLLLRGCQVYFLRPLALDLGGIAKGFAVDAAIKVLQRRGVTSAVVNAGGDLRAFGHQAVSVHLRHPSAPQLPAHRLELSDAAIATSSPCFTEQQREGKRVSHLVNPRDHSAVTGNLSVSVQARECWLADALTKVVLNAPRIAEALLAKYNARAFMLTA